MTVSSAIKSLVSLGIREGVLESLDEVWAVNRVLEILQRDSIEEDAPVYEDASLEEILKVLLDYACEKGICEDSVVYRDLLDTKIMGALTPRPSEVVSKFNALYEESPEKATEYYYHISRKSEIKKLVERYDNRQHIITTHSPTLASTFFDSSEHLNCLTKNTNGFTEKIDKDKCALIAELTDNIWNVSDQNTFLASNKPITLLVEGKTDKIHIEEAFKRLKGGYPDLDFDVFSMNSSEHIREVLIGLSCSEIQWNKKFIGIFDNDQAGQRDIGNGFEKENGKEQIKHVKYKDGIASNNFYAFLLPVASGYDKKDGFTIENCYPSEKYEQAFVQAVSDKQGHFAGLSIDKIANDIKNKSKTILADQCKTFDNNDFDGFTPIFDIIEEIRQL